ncbi:hypothetical protein [Myxococcus eversor]|uniref:hypothetical protein n=1 Tax=Myxococcus eversor TaxID=2709661 RepID=UPI0013CF6AB8|nr:hypothetical protein [Myxococcus eversor]
MAQLACCVTARASPCHELCQPLLVGRAPACSRVAKIIGEGGTGLAQADRDEVTRAAPADA